MSTNEKISGIYSIRHKLNGKVYVGKSIDIKKRVNSHMTALYNGKHVNSDLQNDWNECGIDGFEWKILERCKWFDLQEKEQFYIDKYDSKNKGYNMVEALYDPDNHIAKNFTMSLDSFEMLIEMCEADNVSRSELLNEMIKYCYCDTNFEYRNDDTYGFQRLFLVSKRKKEIDYISKGVRKSVEERNKKVLEAKP